MFHPSPPSIASLPPLVTIAPCVTVHSQLGPAVSQHLHSLPGTPVPATGQAGLYEDTPVCQQAGVHIQVSMHSIGTWRHCSPVPWQHGGTATPCSVASLGQCCCMRQWWCSLQVPCCLLQSFKASCFHVWKPDCLVCRVV